MNNKSEKDIFFDSIECIVEENQVNKKNTNSIQQIALEFYKKRDEKSFNKLFKRLKPGLSSYLYPYVKDEYSRESIIMSTFENIWNKIDQYNEDYAFSTWAYRIARNEALLTKRYSNKYKVFEVLTDYGVFSSNNNSYTTDYEYYEPSLEEDIDDLYNKTVNEINQLPEKYKSILTKREIENKSYTIIAEETGIKINTIRTRIRKGRELIYNKMKTTDSRIINRYNRENFR